MRRYFTSDLHLGSTKVLEVCNRPFLDNIEMTDKLIMNCNEIAKDKEDVIYHIGDLYCLKDDMGHPGMLLPWRETRKRFIADVVNVLADDSLIDADTGAFHLDSANLLTYSHGQYNATGEPLGHFGFSVKKKK